MVKVKKNKCENWLYDDIKMYIYIFIFADLLIIL